MTKEKQAVYRFFFCCCCNTIEKKKDDKKILDRLGVSSPFTPTKISGYMLLYFHSYVDMKKHIEYKVIMHMTHPISRENKSKTKQNIPSFFFTTASRRRRRI